MQDSDLKARIIKVATKVLEYLPFKKTYVELTDLEQQELMIDCIDYTQEHCQKSVLKYGEKAYEERILFYPIDSYFRQHFRKLKNNGR